MMAKEGLKRVPIPCPDGKAGCIVAHYAYVPEEPITNEELLTMPRNAMPFNEHSVIVPKAVLQAMCLELLNSRNYKGV